MPLKVAYFTCENENRYCWKRGRINWMKSARIYTEKSPIQESVLWLLVMTQHRKITVTFKFYINVCHYVCIIMDGFRTNSKQRLVKLRIYLNNLLTIDWILLLLVSITHLTFSVDKSWHAVIPQRRWSCWMRQQECDCWLNCLSAQSFFNFLPNCL